MKYRKLYIKKFRKFEECSFDFGKKITVISGVNGIGKSSLLSMIASSTGTFDKRLLGANFQPEFTDYFKINSKEPFENYRLYIQFDAKLKHKNNDYFLTKRIGFRDDTDSGRGIRSLPRHSKPLEEVMNDTSFITAETAKQEAAKQLNITDSKRIPLPTIYLSLSRLFPLGETDLSYTKLSTRTNFLKKGYADYYINAYNAVLPNSINKDSPIASILTKNITNKKRVNLTLNDSYISTQSVGQDNLGSIITALTDFYALKDKLGKKYPGGVLCIDEIDASLHPSAVVSLFNLLRDAAEPDNLNLQILVTTHSLTILKRIIELEKVNPEDYKLVYFKDVDLPRVDMIQSYNNLKADMFDELSFISPKINVYCEDPQTVKLFKLLTDIITSLELISPDKLANLNIINIELGKQQLLNLPSLDPYFKSTLIVLDGDAKSKKELNKTDAMHSDMNHYQREHTARTLKFKNIVTLPTFFSPEVFLFNLIKEITINSTKYRNFWNSVGAIPELSNHTVQRVKEEFLIAPQTDYDNIHNSQKWFSAALEFVRKSKLIEFYYNRSNSSDSALSDFADKLNSAIVWLNNNNKSKLF